MDTLQRDRLDVQMIEQAHTVAEQKRRHVKVDLVHQACVETLLQDAGSADDNVLFTGSFLSLPNGSLHTVCDKRERRPLRDPFLWNVMGHDKGGTARRVAAPGVGDVKRSSSSDSGSISRHGILEKFGTLF